MAVRMKRLAGEQRLASCGYLFNQSFRDVRAVSVEVFGNATKGAISPEEKPSNWGQNSKEGKYRDGGQWKLKEDGVQWKKGLAQKQPGIMNDRIEAHNKEEPTKRIFTES
ncbi:hypothetical protein K0M31_012230 [Melipona bicolor]|uniref:Uncharacterized protein n=1 Tax=Melipona bicolor TaxID=60889 RepID=A0AA40KHK4_9HYME|nr:hypothetical protein K0M31_012230 [Melipona bicolor]